MKLLKPVVAATGFLVLAFPFGLRADDTAPAANAGQAAPAEKNAGDEMPNTGVEVMKMVLAKDVKDHDPVEEITTAKVGDVVVGWSQIRSGMGEVTITHRWLHEKDNM